MKTSNIVSSFLVFQKLLSLFWDVNRRDEFFYFITGQEISPYGNFLRYSTITDDFPQKPNGAARIGFMLYYPFNYFLYKNIYNLLPDSEFIVIEDGGAISAKKQLQEFLIQQGVFFRTFSNSLNNPEKFFSKYDIIVSHIPANILTDPALAKLKKIRLMYGHAKDLWNFGAWNRHFDLALVYGKYSQKRISPFTSARVVGVPHFDKWFAKTPDFPRNETIEKRLDFGKKTILYLPTHGDLSSLPFLGEIITRLAASYNIIFRPHPISRYREPEVIKKFLSHPSMISIDDFQDPSELFRYADIVLSDSSGSIFEAILTDKPVVITDFLDDGYLNKEHSRMERLTKTDWKLPLTYPQSIEQIIKHDARLRPGPIVTIPEQVNEAVRLGLTDPEHFKAGRQRVRLMLFPHLDGSASQRAASAIRGFLNEPRQARNFISLRIDTEIQIARTKKWDRLQKLRKTVYDLNIHAPVLKPVAEHDDNKPMVSVVIATFNRSKSLEQTLETIIGQSFDKDCYEIVIVNDGSTDDTDMVVRDFFKKHGRNKRPSVVYAPLRQNCGISAARNVGISIASGEFICFTDDDCILPPGWIEELMDGFKRYPEVAAVGGWYRVPGENSFYDQYIFWKPLRKFGSKIFSQNIRGTNLSDTPAGNTANICFRKRVLEMIGGFNPVIRFSSLDDFELKQRLRDHGFVTLYIPLFVDHAKECKTFSQFLRFNFIRGWASDIYFRLHPHVDHYNFSILNTVRFIRREIADIYLDGGIKHKAHFVALSTIANIVRYLGKFYWFFLPLDMFSKFAETEAAMENL